MARTTGFNGSQIIAVRTGVGVIAADSTTLTDANIDPTKVINCKGFDSIFVGCEVTGGTAPTMTIEPLFRDADAADGSRWRRLLVGAPDGVTLSSAVGRTTGAVAADLSMAELMVYGWPAVFLRITAVTNPASTTAWSVVAIPGRVRPSR